VYLPPPPQEGFDSMERVKGMEEEDLNEMQVRESKEWAESRE
jgi:hypothetical protein